MKFKLGLIPNRNRKQKKQKKSPSKTKSWKLMNKIQTSLFNRTIINIKKLLALKITKMK